MLEIHLLGTFDIKDGKKAVSITSRPAQSLLAYLVLNAGTSHRREKLAGMLWPDSLEETARDNLRHALWRIRKALPLPSKVEYIVADDLSIAFNASAEYWLDAAELEKQRESVSADELIAVLSQYQGELLPGFYDEWVFLEREHLNSVFENKMARLMSLLQDENRWQDILDWGERWIKLGQKPEPAYRCLMSAHAAKGDMSRVAATYQRCVKSFKEFGIEPSEQTRALYERLKLGTETLETGSSVPVRERRKESRKTNLPVPLTSFIGREKEVDEIIHLLNRNRLMTLLGSGGVGKTRLAIQSSNKLMNKFRDGIWWIDLVGVKDDSLVVKEVARVLELIESPDQPVIDLLVSHIASRQMLLVLDNCEHLVSACAQLADQLLSACENLKILATSREALDIFGEMAWHVPSLTLPIADTTVQGLDKYESVRLFLERAKVMQPQFSLSEQNAKAVIQICRRLSGMPLAIELAAARVKMMSVDEIASRLDDRFNLLTSGSRAALPRHQTLRATIDWSYDLLASPERILLRRMAVFSGGFTLEGVEIVCSSQDLKRREILDLIGRMVDKSLVIVEQSLTSATRYRMLETIREYARQKLEEAGEMVDLHNRHLEYFVRLAEEAERNTFGAYSVKYHRRLDEELDDIRTAMEWSIQTHQATMAFRLGAALFYFWYNRSSIGGDWLRQLNRALQLPEGTERTAERAQALNAKGYFYWADVTSDNPRPSLEEALSISRELGNNAIAARALCNLGLVETVEGNHEKARSYFEESLELFSKVDSSIVEYIWSLTFLGDIDFNQNDLNNAQIHYEQSASALREIRDRNFLAYVVRRLGQLAWHCSEFDKASLLCNESLTINQELGDERGVIASLSAFAGKATAEGNLAYAAQLFGAVETLLRSKNIRLVYMDRLERERNTAILGDQLSPDAMDKAWRKGISMTMEQAVDFAIHKSGNS
ncbi:MAG TPA: tetratricopeptide repeat protein [Anaerolineales bacterium]|nr:tetratricopeptide repeat protein [Anaerolineales bacterium]